MAEINVERKRPSIWPWIVGIVALLAVLWIWGAATDEEQPAEFAATEPAPGAPAAPAGTAGVGGAVDEYVQFAGAAGGEQQRGQMGVEHEYTAEGIRKLRAALETVVDREGDTDSRASLERFREVADRIQQDPESTRHAGLVRDAFTRAAEVVASLEGARGADNLKSVAESINPDQPLLDQREAVRTFFRESAQAIETAARS